MIRAAQYVLKPANGVGRVSEATIRKYIDEQTTRPAKGKP